MPAGPERANSGWPRTGGPATRSKEAGGDQSTIKEVTRDD
jgi:hypothetical protein